MIQKIFLYDNINNNIELNTEEILLVKEFKALLSKDRNISKDDPKGTLGLRAFREFLFIWLSFDWQSIYADYSEKERLEEAKADSGLTDKLLKDKVFLAACDKYKLLLELNRSIKMLRSALNVVDKFIAYFNNIDPEERDIVTNKPVFKVKDIILEVTSLSKIHQELITLENQIKKELAEDSGLRGGAVDGFIPNLD